MGRVIRGNLGINIQPRERVHKDPFTKLDNISELDSQNIEIQITPKDTDISEVLSEESDMTQVEVPHLMKLNSETQTNMVTKSTFSSLPKVLIPVNSSMPDLRLPSKPVISCQLTKSQKVPLFATLKNMLVTEDQSVELPVLTLLSSVTPKMVPSQELDCHLDKERPSPVSVDVPSVSLPVVVELISQS